MNILAQKKYQILTKNIVKEEFDKRVCNEYMAIPEFVFNKNELSSDELNELIKFTDKVIRNINMQSNTPYFKWVTKIIQKNPYCGLSNFNAYCFINCTFQVLFSSDHFQKAMADHKGKTIFFSKISELYDKMQNSPVVNQIEILKTIDSNYNLSFNIFTKNGRVSDVIRSISQICKDHNCKIFDFEANSALFFKYPIIKHNKKFKISKKSKIANLLIKNLHENKILIFSGGLEESSHTPSLGKNGEFLIIHGKTYKLFGVIERIINKFIHTRSYAIRDGYWYLFNDECVTKSSKKHVLERVEPYFAFYEQI